MDRILKDYKVMDRFAFLLSFLLGALMTVTLQAQKIIPLWQNNMPNSKGIALKDSVARERVVQVGTPTIHVYEPSKAERTGTAVLIIPGGGYVKLAHEISGIALAKWYNTLGVTAFVLMHRFPQSPDVIESYKAPLQDGQRALRYIRAHAEEYGIDIHKVGVMGCSAGGHLAASLCAIDEDWAKVGDTLDAYSCKPSFAVQNARYTVWPKQIPSKSLYLFSSTDCLIICLFWPVRSVLGIMVKKLFGIILASKKYCFIFAGNLRT